MGCFRREQLSFGVLWDKLIWLKSHLTFEAASEEVSGMNAFMFLKVLANTVSIKLKCGSLFPSLHKKVI